HSLALPPTEIRDSGNGLHAIWRLKELLVDGAGLEQAETIMKRLVALLAGDSAVTHRAALLRRPGTDNTKEGIHRPCSVIESTGAVYDISEFGDLLDLYGDQPLLHYKEREEAAPNGKSNGADSAPRSGPVDIDGELAAMKNGAHVNQTQPRIISSLIRKGWHPDEILDFVVDHTMEMAGRVGLKWTREIEEECVRRRISSSYHCVFEGEYDFSSGEIPIWLP